MEVVNKAIGYKVDCPFCKSVLKFDREDMKYTFPYENAVKCPVCERTICVADVCGELSSIVEPIYDKGMSVVDKYDAYRNIIPCGGKKE